MEHKELTERLYKVAIYSDPLSTDATRRILQVFDEKAIGSPPPVVAPGGERKPSTETEFARLTGPAFRRISRSRFRAPHLISGVTYTITELGTPTAQVTATVNRRVLTVTGVTSGALAIGQAVFGTGIIAGTTITRRLTGRGGVGTYRISRRHSSLTSRTINTLARGSTIVLNGAVANASFSGTNMTVTAPVSGTLRVGQSITGTGITPIFPCPRKTTSSGILYIGIPPEKI